MSMREELEKKGYINLGEVYDNLSPAILVEEALLRGEGELTATGALSVHTGKYTGRSPKDRYFVETAKEMDTIDWGDGNKGISVEKFTGIKRRQMAYLEGKDVFVFDGFIGADEKHRIAVRVINEYAWQNLFIHQLLRRPTAEEQANFQPEITLVCTPGFKAIPEIDGTRSEAFIILNLESKEILIGAASYAGEMKKSCFTAMNYLTLYGDKDMAVHQENWLVGGPGLKRVNECVKCGKCEEACPQHIQIRAELERVSENLLK